MSTLNPVYTLGLAKKFAKIYKFYLRCMIQGAKLRMVGVVSAVLTLAGHFLDKPWAGGPNWSQSK